MPRLSLFIFLLFTPICLFSQTGKRPRIGLVLSGGGAKGLAHIGVLEVLDQVGLKVDYITGTSMGSIIGGLYAMGYSGDSIHKIATSEDWEALLSNQIPLKYIPPDEKSEYGQYNIEVGLDAGKVRMPTGFLDGHLLSLELSRLSIPVLGRQKFSEFPIPFKCIATDIETGTIEVLDSGNIAEALRASMAIPSLFTPVYFNGKYLIDGGVLHNFPVSDAKEMGADIIIGVNVSSGILPATKLTSIASILFQSISLGGNADFTEQKKKVDYFLQPALDNYSVGDFGKVDSIIAIGRQSGEIFRKTFEALKDSLNKLYPRQFDHQAQTLGQKNFYFSDIDIIGLKTYTTSFVKKSLAFKTNESVSSDDLEQSINQLMGSQNFRKISYELVHGKDSSLNKLRIKVQESARFTAKIDLNYNTLFKTSFILKLTARNLLLPNSKFISNFNIGDNVRIRGSYGKYFGVRQRIQVNTYFNYDQYDIPGVIASSDILQYSKLDKMNTYSFGFELQKRILMPMSVHFGIVNEYFNIKNLINSTGSASSVRSSDFSVYLNAHYNTLNKVNYATKGLKIFANASYIFDYQYRFADINGNLVDLELPDLSITPDQIKTSFQQIYTSISHCFPLLRKTTVLNNGYLGFTFNTGLTFSHFYRLGGLRENFQGNVPFVGIKEFSHRQSPFLMNNVVAYHLGIQQEFWKGIYLIPRANVASVASQADQLTLDTSDPYHFLFGGGLTLAYNSPFGPLEMSLMKSNQFNDLSLYVNFGFNFYNR
jgi:NTE family protein